MNLASWIFWWSQRVFRACLFCLIFLSPLRVVLRVLVILKLFFFFLLLCFWSFVSVSVFFCLCFSFPVCVCVCVFVVVVYDYILQWSSWQAARSVVRVLIGFFVFSWYLCSESFAAAGGGEDSNRRRLRRGRWRFGGDAYCYCCCSWSFYPFFPSAMRVLEMINLLISRVSIRLFSLWKSSFFLPVLSLRNNSHRFHKTLD
jgi:hypothetical protein